MRRRLALILGGLSALGLLLSACSEPGDSSSISLATGGTAGVYFPLGGGMAQAFTNNVEDLNVTAESTGGSIVNIRLIEAGDAELAIVQNDIASYAHNGEEMFANGKQGGKVRGMAMLYPEIIQIVTLAEKNIASVDDLRGKRIAVGAPGSGTEANARQILDVHGISYADITPHHLPFGEAVEALRDGRIDAAFLTAGIPTAAVIDLGATQDVRIVPIAPDKARGIAELWNFYTPFTIPGGTYTDVQEDIPTVTVQAMLVVTAELDADHVHRMLEVLFDESTLKSLCTTHARGCDISLDTALTALPIPLHPGAQRFYGEQQ